MISVIIWGVACILIVIAADLIPYIYKLNMMGKVRIYKLDTGFAVKQFGYSTYSQICYRYDSSYYYDWFWVTKEKQPTYNPIPMSQTEAEELAQSLQDDYMRYYVQEHELYLAEKSKEKIKKSAKLFKKL